MCFLTFSEKVTVKMMLKMNIPASPVRCRVRLPARSIRGMVIRVIPTMMPPTPRVAYFAVSSSKPTLVKRFVE